MASRYYSERVGRGPLAKPTIRDLGRSVTLAVAEMEKRGYLEEWFGTTCIDSGPAVGRSGMSLAEYIEVETGRREAWPLREAFSRAERDSERLSELVDSERRSAEDEVFDLIEFFYRHISQGVEATGVYHSFGDCGWHFQDYDPRPAQGYFRARMNRFLPNYGNGYRLTLDGEIEHAVEAGMDQLIDAPLHATHPDVAQRVSGAIELYRNRGRTPDDLRRAVRDLFDALEKLRPSVKSEMLKGDEADLFNIANNFTIRHLSETQKGNYDSVSWHSWMFYVNLATIHLITRTITRYSSTTTDGPNVAHQRG